MQTGFRVGGGGGECGAAHARAHGIAAVEIVVCRIHAAHCSLNSCRRTCSGPGLPSVSFEVIASLQQEA